MMKASKSYVIACLLLIALIVELCFVPIQTTDIFMYLAIAREFSRHGGFFSTDPFLFSLPGAVLRYKHEWLSHIVYYGAFKLAGYTGLIALKTAAYAAAMGVSIWVAGRKKVFTPVVILMGTLAAYASAYRFIERSSTFSDLLTCVVLAITLLEREKPSGKRWALPFIMCLWINLHGAFPVGFIIMGLVLIADVKQWRSPSYRSWLMCLGLSVLACLINPEGLSGLLFPFRFVSGEAVTWKEYILEFFPVWHPYYRSQLETWLFISLLIFNLALLIASWKRRPYYEALVFLFLCYVGLWAVREIPKVSFAVVLLSAYLAAPFRVFQRRWAQFALMFSSGVLLSLCIKIAVSGYWTAAGLRSLGTGVDDRFYARESLEIIDRVKLSAPIFNSYDHGGFLAWVWGPARKIYIHGFIDNLDFFVHDYMAIDDSLQEFNRVVGKYHLAGFLLTKLQGETGLIKILKSNPDWQLVFEDRATFLFLKRDPSILK